MSPHPALFTQQQWKAGNGKPLISYNPANHEIVWEGKSTTAEQVNEAVVHARSAYKNWSTLTLNERSKYLEQFGEVLEHSQSFLAETISREIGKPLWDSKAEILSVINKIGLSLEAYGRRCSGIIRDYPHARSITRHRPHGVLAVLGPFNFPAHLPHGHIIPALLAGNTIVFKPSELSPLVAEEMIKCWEKANLPAGVINLVQGSHETGQALIHHPDINGLLFTGSYPTGLLLSKVFAPHPEKILVLEMGGNNPLIIGQISDFNAAAYLTIQSAYVSSGQRCTCARRLIVPKGANGDQFLHLLIQKTQNIITGDYQEIPEPFIGPVISETQALKLLSDQQTLIDQGGIPLVLMKHLKPGTGFVSPALIDVTPISERADKEIFGPFLQVIRVANFEEALREANQTQYGMTAGLFSENYEEYTKFYQEIRAGVINWNTPLTGASSAAPFGGIGHSGNYRPSAYYAADYCSYPVASMEAVDLRLPSQIPPGLPFQ